MFTDTCDAWPEQSVEILQYTVLFTNSIRQGCVICDQADEI